MNPIPNRYHRQTILPQVGEAGQHALGAAHAVVIGCGALGTPAAELLARAGVGRLTLVDRDIVEPTNLQRQLLFDEEDARAGLPKAEAARRRLTRVNSEIAIDALVADVNHRNIERLLEGATVVLDCCDNFETRYLLNDACVKRAAPLVYAGAVGVSGMLLTVAPGITPCLRCTFDAPPAPGASPTCDTAGVLGPLTAMLGSLQAAEAIKLIVGEPPSSRMLSVDAWRTEFRSLDRGSPRADCPCCAERRFEWLAGKHAPDAAALCGRESVQITPASSETARRLDLAALAARLKPHGEFDASSFLLRGRLRTETTSEGAPIELTVFADARAIIGGVTRVEQARAIYAKYVGA